MLFLLNMILISRARVIILNVAIYVCWKVLYMNIHALYLIVPDVSEMHQEAHHYSWVLLAAQITIVVFFTWFPFVLFVIGSPEIFCLRKPSRQILLYLISLDCLSLGYESNLKLILLVKNILSFECTAAKSHKKLFVINVKLTPNRVVIISRHLSPEKTIFALAKSMIKSVAKTIELILSFIALRVKWMSLLPCTLNVIKISSVATARRSIRVMNLVHLSLFFISRVLVDFRSLNFFYFLVCWPNKGTDGSRMFKFWRGLIFSRCKLNTSFSIIRVASTVAQDIYFMSFVLIVLHIWISVLMILNKKVFTFRF